MPRPFFHKLILSSTIQERKLRIPDSFVKKFKNELSIAAALTVPDGHVWRLGLRKADNKIWFQDGWQEFVDRYSIRTGYFLVFRYEGNSAFSVYIFNLPTSEINYQYIGINGLEAHNHYRRNRVFDELEDEGDVEIMGSSSMLPIPDSVTLDRDNYSSTFQNLFSGCEDEKLSKFKKGGRKKQKVEPYEQTQLAQHYGNPDMRFRFYESASARKRPVTTEERERAINASKLYEPANPFCRVVLRPSYLYRGCIMYLPSCFAEKNLSGISGFINLQLSDGKQWPVRCLYRGGRAKLSQGWYEFTLENRIGEGDVCVFELLRARDFVLKVTVFRVHESV